MLVTTCGHCQSRFRVTPQQLNARQGQVRCGRCQAVFNGFQALERFPDDDTGGRLLAEQEARNAAEQQATDTAQTFEPSLPADPGDLPDLETVEEAPPAAPPKPAAPPTARAARIEPDLLLEPPRKARPARAWAFGAALLSVVLLAQLAFAFRGPVAQRYPALRPSLEAACAWLRCSVPYAREDGLLKLEDSELLEVPGKPNEIALGARIRNLASVAQEYPHLELTLTDNSGQPAARRVLRPTDYLGRPLAPGEVIGPGVELALQMRLETPRLKATGYELLLFYP
ncbi:MAG TPA: zinc-ribbon and DUF3426 domain-containing protein [Usitatibacter sp.]|nr:zinc-ribbon and DUF3426 domain-containing protein [Usitatibacter sp.]